MPHHDSADDLGDGIPVTYVPARNTIFLSFALAWAETLGASDIFIGVNALDYSGYPDCRPEYIAAYEQMANLATKAGVEGRQQLTIHTPLIELTKAQIIQRGLELGVDYALTHSCYDPAGDRACGSCDSCLLRRRGFAEVGLTDPAMAVAGLRPAYRVKEIFYTLQGEGTQAGRPAVFCRFTSCNLWTGRERDRASRDLPVLRHRLRRHGRAGRGPVRNRGRPGRRRGRGMAGPAASARPAVRGVHRRRAAAAAGRGRGRRPACRRLRGGGRDERHPPGPRRAWTGSASARRPART